MLERLVHDGPQTATTLADHFPTTRQAIVKHLRVLADAGLVVPERDGREVRYVATTERLADAVNWLLDASRSWDRRLGRLRSRAVTSIADEPTATAPRPSAPAQLHGAGDVRQRPAAGPAPSRPRSSTTSP